VKDPNTEAYEAALKRYQEAARAMTEAQNAYNVAQEEFYAARSAVARFSRTSRDLPQFPRQETWG